MSQLNKIHITSITKAIKEAKIYGNLNLQIVSLFNLYKYYIEFTNGKKEFNTINKKLKQKASKLKYKFPNQLCNYKLQITNKYSGKFVENLPPVVDDVTSDLGGRFSYNFTIEDFTNNFEDPKNDSYSTLLINPKGIDGQLRFNGNPISDTIEIDVEQVVNLSYHVDSSLITDDFNISEVDTSFTFRIADDNSFKLYSSVANIYIINSEFLDNLPATIGDISKQVDNRVTTFLTLNVFTNQMQPPYSDPENDDIDAIRIDKVFSSNSGQFLYNNVPVSEGQVISADDLENNLFKHVGPDQDTINTDLIEFSARDQGSLIWVQ